MSKNTKKFLNVTLRILHLKVDNKIKQKEIQSFKTTRK